MKPALAKAIYVGEDVIAFQERSPDSGISSGSPQMMSPRELQHMSFVAGCRLHKILHPASQTVVTPAIIYTASSSASGSLDLTAYFHHHAHEGGDQVDSNISSSASESPTPTDILGSSDDEGDSLCNPPSTPAEPPARAARSRLTLKRLAPRITCPTLALPANSSAPKPKPLTKKSLSWRDTMLVPQTVVPFSFDDDSDFE